MPEEVKKRRNNDLLAIQNADSLEDHRPRIGDTSKCWSKARASVGERQPAPAPVQLTGRTMTDHIVVFEGHRAADRPDGDGAGQGGESVHALRGRRDEEVAGGELTSRAPTVLRKVGLPLTVSRS